NVKLLINTNKESGVVLLFVRPTNGVYLPPKVIYLQGKSTQEQVAVVKKDMPNLFIEALTVADGKIHTEVREVVVPPEKRVLNVTVLPSQTEYKPGQKASVKVKLTDFFGKPFVGSTVLSIYDKSVEYIAGGSNVPEIREFFWKWRRSHYPQTESSLGHWFGNLLRTGEIGMWNLGRLGAQVLAGKEGVKRKGEGKEQLRQLQGGGGRGDLGDAPPMAPESAAFGAKNGSHRGADRDGAEKPNAEEKAKNEGPPPPPDVQPVVRKNFADT